MTIVHFWFDCDITINKLVILYTLTRRQSNKPGNEYSTNYRGNQMISDSTMKYKIYSKNILISVLGHLGNDDAIRYRDQYLTVL